MARSRNIKPGLFKNELLGESDPIYSLLFAGLWTLADREGRLENRPKRIKAELFPYRFDLDPCLGLEWLKDNSFITMYETGGEKYIQIHNWRKHQNPHHKEIKSTIPPQPEITKQVKTVNNQHYTHACAIHESFMDQEQIKESASSPLIPNSLLLIPDSLVKDIPSNKSEVSLPKNSKYKFSDDHYQIAVELSNPVIQRFPTQDINLEEWADGVRKLIDIDKHTIEQILYLWRWRTDHQGNGNFCWSDNCRTPMKLRLKKDGLSYFEIIKQQIQSQKSKPGSQVQMGRNDDYFS